MNKIRRLLSTAGISALLLGLVLPAVVSAGAYAGTNGKIAYASSSGVKIINSDGTGIVTIPGTDALSGHPRISPDGTKVVWAQYAGGAAADPANIKVANSDGTGTATDITSGAANRNDGATWSPDGKWLLYVNDVALNANYGGAINIVSSAGGSSSSFINAVGCVGATITTDGWEEPSWSQNGSRVAVMNRCDNANGGIYTFGVTGYTAGSNTQPTFDLLPSTHVTADNATPLIDFWPSFSPDNSKIIFTRVSGSNYTIQTATDTASSPLTQLFDGLTNFIAIAAFSPDGSSVVFNQTTSGTAQLKTMASTGGTATAISGSTGATSADWGVAVAVAPPPADPAAPAAPADKAAPGTPDTGIGSLLLGNPLLTLFSAVVSSSALVLLARRYGFLATRT